MKKETIFLPNTTHDALCRRAELEGVDLPQLCSAVLVDFANNSHINKEIEAVFTAPPSVALGLPDTVQQILSIYRYMRGEGLEFSEAVNRTAADFRVHSTTVRDKCTRRISMPDAVVDTPRFLALLSAPSALQRHLCQKFPTHEAEINRRFAEFSNGGNGAAPPPNRPAYPGGEVKENQLVHAIIEFLRSCGGHAPKGDVERAVYQKFKTALAEPYYQQLVGAQVGFAGVPRWQKNIEFARNTAREMGLIKAPSDSGRGIWALTELGKERSRHE